MIDHPLAYTYYNLRNRLGQIAKNPRFIKHYLSKFNQYADIDNYDLYILSYPKSGRTWLQRLIVEAYIVDHDSELSVHDISDLHDLDDAFPRVLLSHAGSCWEESLRVLSKEKLLQIDFKRYLTGRVVYVYRDPRDILVSQYYHMRYRTQINSITPQTLLRSYNVGLPKVIQFMNVWADLIAQSPDNILAVSYENLLGNTEQVLSTVFKFLGLSVSNEALKQSIDKCQITNQSTKESAEAQSPWLYTPNPDNVNSRHARKGQVGEHKELFTSQELREMNVMIQSDLNPSYIGYIK